MSTWDEVNGRLSYFLDDTPQEGGTPLHALPLRIPAWNWAQRVFQAHTKREMTTSLTIRSDGRTALAPPDLLEVMMIYDAASGTVYGKRQFEQRGLRTNLAANYAYWLWSGKIYFDIAVGTNTLLSMEYLAKWPEVIFSIDKDDKIVVSQGEIFVPDWAELPLLCLTAAFVLQPQAIQAAMTRNSNISIDSGRPEDNSRRIQARELFWWYKTLLSEVSAQIKSYGAN
jgi:hypothetical protein